MILEEGMNVKLVILPDGEDPDSFARSHDPEELAEYVKENAKDFIVTKTEILLKGTGNDPILKAGLIKDIVESIAKIPDAIARSVYVKECSTLLDIETAASGRRARPLLVVALVDSVLGPLPSPPRPASSTIRAKSDAPPRRALRLNVLNRIP